MAVAVAGVGFGVAESGGAEMSIGTTGVSGAGHDPNVRGGSLVMVPDSPMHMIWRSPGLMRINFFTQNPVSVMVHVFDMTVSERPYWDLSSLTFTSTNDGTSYISQWESVVPLTFTLVVSGATTVQPDVNVMVLGLTPNFVLGPLDVKADAEFSVANGGRLVFGPGYFRHHGSLTVKGPAGGPPTTIILNSNIVDSIKVLTIEAATTIEAGPWSFTAVNTLLSDNLRFNSNDTTEPVITLGVVNGTAGVGVHLHRPDYVGGSGTTKLNISSLHSEAKLWLTGYGRATTTIVLVAANPVYPLLALAVNNTVVEVECIGCLSSVASALFYDSTLHVKNHNALPVSMQQLQIASTVGVDLTFEPVVAAVTIGFNAGQLPVGDLTVTQPSGVLTFTNMPAGDFDVYIECDGSGSGLGVVAGTGTIEAPPPGIAARLLTFQTNTGGVIEFNGNAGPIGRNVVVEGPGILRGVSAPFVANGDFRLKKLVITCVCGLFCYWF